MDVADVNVDGVARRWASRIRVEFMGHEDLLQIAHQLNSGNSEAVFMEHRHLLKKELTKIPGRPLKLYFLREMMRDLERFYA